MEQNDNWQFLSVAMHQMCVSVNDIGSLIVMLNENEYHPNMTRDERRSILCLLNTQRWKLQRQIVNMKDLADYSMTDRLLREDKVLVNQMCRELAGKQDVKVLFKSDMTDYYTITTNLDALEKVLSILLSHAAVRALSRNDDTRERLVSLSISERAEDGVLTFVVSDTGDPLPAEMAESYFNLPAGGSSQNVNVSGSIENYNCRLLARLLGGFVYTDPAYKDGLRVVFSMAVL